MPIIEPPPTTPKKETVAIRLEVRLLDELRRYAAYAGTKNFSHIIACSLKRVFKADAGYKAWLKAHPDFRPDSKSDRNRTSVAPLASAHSHPASLGTAVATERHVGSRNSIGGA